jgi:uncharacterized membrane protein (GlpM family)
MMNKVLRVLVLLPAILFVVIGLRWLVDPAGVAPQFGLILQDGVGLSSQIGDMSGFFLTAGMLILIALITNRRTWYYPPIMLLSITAVGRVVAWLIHDAALAVDSIAIEVIVSVLLLIASRRLADRE